MKRIHQTCTIPTVLVTLVVTAVLAACGRSSPKPSPAKNPQLALCMRAHGVPNFPDPTNHRLRVMLSA
jgi:hypothetical protein